MAIISRIVTIQLQPFVPYINLTLQNSYWTGIWLSNIIILMGLWLKNVVVKQLRGWGSLQQGLEFQRLFRASKILGTQILSLFYGTEELKLKLPNPDLHVIYEEIRTELLILTICKEGHPEYSCIYPSLVLCQPSHHCLMSNNPPDLPCFCWWCFRCSTPNNVRLAIKQYRTIMKTS